MEFVRLEDVRRMLDHAWDGMEMERQFQKLKVYKADYKPYMPIRLRDYGYLEDGKPMEFECGSDQHHDWLQIQEDGSLQYVNMQSGAGCTDEESAKDWEENCFIPTFEVKDEFGELEKYITPRCYLVIDEVETEGGESNESD